MASSGDWAGPAVAEDVADDVVPVVADTAVPAGVVELLAVATVAVVWGAGGRVAGAGVPLGGVVDGAPVRLVPQAAPNARVVTTSQHVDFTAVSVPRPPGRRQGHWSWGGVADTSPRCLVSRRADAQWGGGPHACVRLGRGRA